MGIQKRDYFRRSYRIFNTDFITTKSPRIVRELFVESRISDLVIPLADALGIHNDYLQELSSAGIHLHLEVSSTDFSMLGGLQEISNHWSELHILPGILNTIEDIFFVHDTLTRRSNARITVILPSLKEYDLLMIVPKLVERGIQCALDPQSFSPKRTNCLTVEEIVKLRRQLKKKGIEIDRHPGRTINGNVLHPMAWPDSSLSASWESGPPRKNVKYSIISPCYNSKEFFSNVIRHLLNLNADPQSFEIVIVDDGSSDSPSSVIQNLTNQYPDISVRYFYWPKPKNEKLFRAGQARALGAMKARGEYLVFVDSDILVSADFLSEVEKSLSRSDIVQFVRHHIHPKFSFPNTLYSQVEKHMTFIEEDDYWGQFYSMTNWMEAKQHWKYTCSYALALSKNDFWMCGGFSTNYISYGFEDTEIGYRMAHYGKKFELNHMKVFHLTAPNQMYSKWERQMSIADSAKIFYLNHFDDELVSDFGLLMSEPFRFFVRLKDKWIRNSTAQEV